MKRFLTLPLLAYALGTPIWGYSTTLLGHASVAALFVIVLVGVARGGAFDQRLCRVERAARQQQVDARQKQRRAVGIGIHWRVQFGQGERFGEALDGGQPLHRLQQPDIGPQ